MTNNACRRRPRYRVWITLEGGSAEGRGAAIAVAPAERGTMSARHAARYVAVYNRVAAEHGRPERAVALPVAVRYDGDPAPGEPLGT